MARSPDARGHYFAAAVERPHVHRFHARRANGGQAQVGVFVGAAEFRVHADAARGFEENVRRGFLVLSPSRW